MLPFVYHTGYMAQLRPGHRFPMSKYAYLHQALITRGLLPSAGGYYAPTAAHLGMAAAVHEIGYVERVFDARMTVAEAKLIGLPSTPAVGMRARLSVSGTTLAARLALEHGIGCNMAGGSHHAGPVGGAGFCVFNDVAVAAQALLDEGLVSRIVVLDLDVHQGDGTARIFEADRRVFTISVHCQNNYPNDKATSDVDIGLPDGLEDAEYLRVVDQAIERALVERPDILFFNAGVDPFKEDRLGRLSITMHGLQAREAAVFRACQRAALPCVGVLGGGYSTDAAELANRHAILFEEAAKALRRIKV